MLPLPYNSNMASQLLALMLQRFTTLLRCYAAGDCLKFTLVLDDSNDRAEYIFATCTFCNLSRAERMLMSMKLLLFSGSAMAIAIGF